MADFKPFGMQTDGLDSHMPQCTHLEIAGHAAPKDMMTHDAAGQIKNPAYPTLSRKLNSKLKKSAKAFTKCQLIAIRGSTNCISPVRA